MEKMFKWVGQAHNIRYVSLRYFNACGAHNSGEIGEDHKPESHLIPLILQVPNGKREFISVYGDDYDTKDGTCVRDYIHVTYTYIYWHIFLPLNTFKQADKVTYLTSETE